MTHLPRRCGCALFLALLHGASALSRAQAISFRPELPGLQRLGKVKPLRSTQIRESYWGIQAGSFRDSVLEKASAIGVKWTRLEANWPSIEKSLENTIGRAPIWHSTPLCAPASLHL
jgi:hypothetical protein